MRRRHFRALLIFAALLTTMAAIRPTARAAAERRFLYVAEPGIRNYVEYGGVGVLVFDADRGYAFVRRIPSQEVAEGAKPEAPKGVARPNQPPKPADPAELKLRPNANGKPGVKRHSPGSVPPSYSKSNMF